MQKSSRVKRSIKPQVEVLAHLLFIRHKLILMKAIRGKKKLRLVNFYFVDVSDKYYTDTRLNRQATCMQNKACRIHLVKLYDPRPDSYEESSPTK